MARSYRKLSREFQLTTSRRGRPNASRVGHDQEAVSTHDLTKRSTNFYDFWHCFLKFQLTTSRRGRLDSTNIVVWAIVVSTHDLTKRSTLQVPQKAMLAGCFNSRPHEEVDLYFLFPFFIFTPCFNSRPHEEVD